jgi:hypothetical protein
MNNQLIELGLKGVRDSLKQNSSTWLAGLSVGGVLTSMVLMHRATLKANNLIEEEYAIRLAEWPDTNPGIKFEELSKKELAKLTWHCYIPPVLAGTLTIAGIIGSNYISRHQNAALAALYGLSEAAFMEYKEKVREQLGEKKEDKLKDSILQDRLDKNPIAGNQVIITGKGDTLCYDSLSGRYFRSDIETIRRIQNDFNECLLVERYKTVNELYYELGLDYTEFGRNIGWSTEYGLVDFKFSAKLATDGTPCIVLDYRIAPHNL